MNHIPGSPHQIPKGFKEWLPTFSREDIALVEDHLNKFLRSLEPYDQYEDVQMRLFSCTLVGKAQDWYENISTRTIKKWDTFRDIFIRRFTKRKDCIFLYDEFYHCKKNLVEHIHDFNNRFKILVKIFSWDFEATQNSVFKTYISAIKNPCGFIIGITHPYTLIEAQERTCEIEENLDSSFHWVEDCPK